MKTLIIDSNNLIYKIPHLKNLFIKDKESAQIALVESVKSGSGKGYRLIFVFDGFGSIKNPEVLYSNKLTADEIIRTKIENFKDCKKLKIVSSDHGITDLARICGCEVQRSEDFWKEISKGKSVTSGKNINQNFIYDKLEKPERMSKKEIDEFKKYFT